MCGSKIVFMLQAFALLGVCQVAPHRNLSILPALFLEAQDVVFAEIAIIRQP